ncbi:MAG: Clp protease [Mycolicibacterium sp.]|nr:Clp protease [Mycolicibacterium sp.]
MFQRFNRDAHVAVILAQQEADDMGASEIMPGHLLLGVLRSAGHDLSSLLAGHGVAADAVRQQLVDDEDAPLTNEDAAALRSIGIDLDQVLDRITRTFGADAFARFDRRHSRSRRGRARFTRSAKKTIEHALREALAHKDDWIGCEHIVLGMLGGSDDAAARVLTERVEAQQLRAEVIALLDKAA